MELGQLTLPIGRLDLCPSCGIELHVCRLCVHYLPSAPDACIEDDAEAVHDKTRANFCEFYRPRDDAFDGAAKRAEQRAREGLSALFGESSGDRDAGPDPEPDEDDPLAKARELFDR